MIYFVYGIKKHMVIGQHFQNWNNDGNNSAQTGRECKLALFSANILSVCIKVLKKNFPELEQLVK